MTVTNPNPGHETTPMIHPRWEEIVHVDKLLAPVVAACWDNGIDTFGCCQDIDGIANIDFPTVQDMCDFAVLVGVSGVDTSTGWRWSSWSNGNDDCDDDMGSVGFPAAQIGDLAAAVVNASES
jgi:hypothetical protein